MIGRFLASTAVAGVLVTSAAMAQMSAPPPNNAPADQPARIQTQNPAPRDQANPAMNSDQQRRDQIGQAGGGTATDNSGTSMSRDRSNDDRSMTQRAGDSMRRAGQKVKSAFSSDKSNARAKQSAQGHDKDNIADQLNACQAKPQADRQACIDQATRM
ncbi:MAG TPA: hypothetical protein VGB82_13745 [Alphaproteobacteria bacterium]